MKPKQKKIAIIGAGAMGSVFGAMLSSVSQVFFINPDNPHVHIIEEKGLTVEHLDKKKTLYEIKIYKDYKKAPEKADIAIILTKSHATEKAAEAAVSVIKEGGLIITFQNGLGNSEIISKIAGEEKVAAGVTSHGATMIEPGFVRHAGSGETFIASNPNRTDLIKKTVDIFGKAGIKIEIKENIDSIIWGKLVINSAINALAAILRVKNGFLDCAEGEKIMKNAAIETANIAAGLNISLPFDDPLKAVKKVCRATAENRSSMFQDTIKKKKTEIDAINYAIVKKGESLGIQTPYNKFLSEMIKAVEKTYV